MANISPECVRAMVTAVKNDLQLRELQAIRDKVVIDIDNRLREIIAKIRNKYNE